MVGLTWVTIDLCTTDIWKNYFLIDRVLFLFNRRISLICVADTAGVRVVKSEAHA